MLTNRKCRRQDILPHRGWGGGDIKHFKTLFIYRYICSYLLYFVYDLSILFRPSTGKSMFTKPIQISLELPILLFSSIRKTAYQSLVWTNITKVVFRNLNNQTSKCQHQTKLKFPKCINPTSSFAPLYFSYSYIIIVFILISL